MKRKNHSKSTRQPPDQFYLLFFLTFGSALIDPGNPPLFPIILKKIGTNFEQISLLFLVISFVTTSTTSALLCEATTPSMNSARSGGLREKSGGNSSPV